MRPSTAEGWYVLPIIVVSFRKFRGKKPVALRPVNAPTGCAHNKLKIPREHPNPRPERADALHHPAGGRGPCEPGDGAGNGLAPAAARPRLRNHGGRSLDRGRGLRG